ncbi:MAG: hypothetical protein ACE5G9_11295 [Nitrospinales bacterium]
MIKRHTPATHAAATTRSQGELCITWDFIVPVSSRAAIDGVAIQPDHAR